jgi:hypothetical protein
VSPFERNNQWMIAMAMATVAPGHVYALLVWDGHSSGDGEGGTADFADDVRRIGGHISIINPMRLPQQRKDDLP